ncbi:16311_t:CDS:2 [Cetraspora pellucida]|uniref:16311_t:CDS:1 n=1 Tax=Cetraspora pellucida TaxID=1433469 RepID=A0A9N9F9G3_9GLOM|nr:16311_t:CDS:2 [Cetraspora pellucida]
MAIEEFPISEERKDLNLISKTNINKLVKVESLTNMQKEEAALILEEFSELFSTRLDWLGYVAEVHHEIDMENAKPTRQAAYQVAPDEQNFLNKEIDKAKKATGVDNSTTGYGILYKVTWAYQNRYYSARRTKDSEDNSMNINKKYLMTHQNGLMKSWNSTVTMKHMTRVTLIISAWVIVNIGEIPTLTRESTITSRSTWKTLRNSDYKGIKNTHKLKKEKRTQYSSRFKPNDKIQSSPGHQYPGKYKELKYPKQTVKGSSGHETEPILFQLHKHPLGAHLQYVYSLK